MKHLKHINESWKPSYTKEEVDAFYDDLSVIKDVMNIAIDDPMLKTIEMTRNRTNSQELLSNDGEYSWNILKTSKASDDYLVGVIKNMEDRFENEGIDVVDITISVNGDKGNIFWVSLKGDPDSKRSDTAYDRETQMIMGVNVSIDMLKNREDLNGGGYVYKRREYIKNLPPNTK